MANWFWDPQNGNDANDGSSFALRKKTLGNFTSAIAGDTIRCITSGPVTNTGETATWTQGSTAVTYSSTAIKEVADCDTNWTAAANVTCSSNTSTRREGTGSQQLAFAAGFTTGKAAYFALGGATNYSTYQQISFWFQPTTNSPSANTFRISLCSDTTGDVQVDNFDISFATTQALWLPITIDKGSALGASIQSVAIYCLSDPGTNTILIDNIFATKSPATASTIHLNHLISTYDNTQDQATWWAIRSITESGGTVTITLDRWPQMTPTGASRGFYDWVSLNGTTDLFKRDTLWATANQTVPTSANGLIISGGWNATDMSTQPSFTLANPGESWIDFRGGNFSMSTSVSSGGTMERIGVTRSNASAGLTIAAANWTADILGVNNCQGTGLSCSAGSSGLVLNLKSAAANNIGAQISSSDCTITNLYNIYSSTLIGLQCTQQFITNHTGNILCSNNATGAFFTGGGFFNVIELEANGSTGLQLSTSNHPYYINTLTSLSNTGSGLGITSSSGYVEAYITELFNTSGNTISAINMNNLYGRLYLYNASMSEANPKATNFPGGSISRVYSHHEGGTTDNHVIRGLSHTISSDTGADRHTASGMAWKVSPTSTTYWSVFQKLRFPVAKVAVNSGQAITLSAWVKRSHATNINARLIIPESIVSTEEIASASASAGTYEQLSLNVTPLLSGVIQVFLDVWATTATDSVWVDDVSVT